MNQVFTRLSAAFAVLAPAVLALGLPVFQVQPALAQTRQPRAVIELFTSQGCSSCPAADALFVELAKDPSLIALTLPVDYWDYLGWKDTLAHSAFSARQKGYAHLRGDGHVYTPQAVINGAGHFVGSDRAAIQTASTAASLPVRVTVSESDGMVRVSVGAAAGRNGAVLILPVVRLREVSIARGENKNRKITYANIVRGVTKIGDWTGDEVRFDVPLATARSGDADGYVVLLQSVMPKPNGTMKAGPILGAVKSAGL
jgi:hypothetical protein